MAANNLYLRSDSILGNGQVAFTVESDAVALGLAELNAHISPYLPYQADRQVGR